MKHSPNTASAHGATRGAALVAGHALRHVGDCTVERAAHHLAGALRLLHALWKHHYHQQQQPLLYNPTEGHGHGCRPHSAAGPSLDWWGFVRQVPCHTVKNY